ncbi:Pimeloyl-ACP methyl ester carboxylesterase [Amycolatopsis xylanica]|uniref:Pimeloyl-ACP methyl ester carboxylesterase n=1 Tax=Amycolatopsis xylanica TaxID=589385 RepID=A0A1H2WAR1_9PSEU|nr:alpha/beta hydrolase [Amycolatopsis xylanica]SDW77129.1 Pimeloyl-ACP methyl ester carboxylesterase [Amycolatopsis xylanica]
MVAEIDHPPMPELEGVSHRWVEANGVRLHVAEAGKGEPVVFLHGFPEHWHAWRHLVPKLSGQYRCVLLDMRGFGWSDAPRGGYGTKTRVADVLAVLDELGLDRVRLVGHEWGAWTGFFACLRAPERFSHFLALNIIHPWPLHHLLVPRVWRFWYTTLLELPGIGRWSQRLGFARWLLRKGFPAGPDESIEEFAAHAERPERARAGEALHRAFILGDIPKLVLNLNHKHRLTVPTVLLGGERDFVFSPKALPGGDRHADDLRLEIVPEAGHYLHEERPDLVADAALTLFKG